jgi:hypothetical protein
VSDGVRGVAHRRLKILSCEARVSLQQVGFGSALAQNTVSG